MSCRKGRRCDVYAMYAMYFECVSVCSCELEKKRMEALLAVVARLLCRSWLPIGTANVNKIKKEFTDGLQGFDPLRRMSFGPLREASFNV